MRSYCLLFVAVVVVCQVACAQAQPHTMWNPVSRKAVRCADEPCAAQYEAAGYMRLNEAQKAQLGLK